MRDLAYSRRPEGRSSLGEAQAGIEAQTDEACLPRGNADRRKDLEAVPLDGHW